MPAPAVSWTLTQDSNIALQLSGDINPMSGRGGSDPLAVPRRSKRQKLVEDSSKGAATVGGGCSEMKRDLAVSKCVSMWKNKKGYLVSIGTRMHSSARSAVAVNVDKFREFNEALDSAEERFNNSQ